MNRRPLILILIAIPFLFCALTSFAILQSCDETYCAVNELENFSPLKVIKKNSNSLVDSSGSSNNNSASDSGSLNCEGNDCDLPASDSSSSNDKDGGGNSTNNDNSSTDSSCKVKDMKFILPMGGGFDISPVDKNLIAYSIPDSDGIAQLHTRNLSTGLDVCLSCNNPNAMSEGLHKGLPSFTADGKYIVLQAEMESHPFEDQLGYLGAGWFNNIWITKLDGSQWWQLTDYPHGANDRFGVLFPKVSPNGKKVAWGYLYSAKPADIYQYSLGNFVENTDPWGLWKLNTADLKLDGTPRLENISSKRLEDGDFYETQNWSSDSSKIMFASDIGKNHPYRIDIWSYNVNDSKLQHLINTDNSWEEMGAFSPHNSKISYMSSDCCNWNPNADAIPFRSSLATELYIMDSDLKNSKQLTSFNSTGIPAGTFVIEFPHIRTIVDNQEWGTDGRSLYFEMLFYNKDQNPQKVAGGGLWRIDFEGECG